MNEHMEHLRIIFQRFKEKGLKFRLQKCFFGVQEMEHQGYTVSTNKNSISTMKVEAVAYSQVPTTQKEVRSFVQFCNF
jgi:predicted acetyltransferase